MNSFFSSLVPSGSDGTLFRPPEIYRQQTENLERGGREALVSFSLIEGGSHYVRCIRSSTFPGC